MEIIPYWKRVWQTVSGTCKTVNESDVTELLDEVKSDLLQGITTFCRFDEHSLEIWRTSVRKSKLNNDLDKLIKRMSIILDLDARMTWRLFCNYLMFEYHGKFEDIQQLVYFEMHMVHLVDTFHHFYSMERMFCLKSLHHIINNYENTEHPFYKCYNHFVKEANICEIRKSLINQLRILHDDIAHRFAATPAIHPNSPPPHTNDLTTNNTNTTTNTNTSTTTTTTSNPPPYRTASHSSGAYAYQRTPALLRRWFTRNTHEQTEICLMLVGTGRRAVDVGVGGATGGGLTAAGGLFGDLVACGRRYNYGVSGLVLQHVDADTVERLRAAWVGAVLVALAHCWNNFQFCLKNRTKLEETFLKNNSGFSDKGILMFSWSLLQTTNPSGRQAAKEFEETYQRYVVETLDKGVLQYMADICNSTVFKYPPDRQRVFAAVHKIVNTLCESVDSDDGMYCYKGSVSVLVALLADETIVPQIVPQAKRDVGLGLCLDTVEQMFPFDFVSFTRVLKVLMPQEKYTRMCLHKLRNIRYFTEEYRDVTIKKGVIQIHTAYKPFHDDIVIIQPNALAKTYERCGHNILIFKSDGYSYFAILEHVLSRLLNPNLLNVPGAPKVTTDPDLTVVLAGFDLLADVLEHDCKVSNEPSVRACLKRLWHLFVAYMTQAKYDHGVVMACLNLCLRLMPQSGPQFLHFFDLNHVLPTISVSDVSGSHFIDVRHLVAGDTFDRILQVDTVVGKHEFIDFIINMLKYARKSGEYYRKIQLPLSIFVFQKLFPKYAVCNYTNPVKVHMLTTILQILHEILFNEPQDPLAKRLYDHSLQMFLKHDVFIQSFLTVFRTCSTLLESLMLHEPDWSNVGALDVMKLCQMSISFVLYVVRLCGGAEALLTHPFGEALTYTSWNCVNSMKVIAGLMNHSFLPSVCEASCRLLIKFSQNTNMSMLGHLEMDSYQVRSMFLEKLRDPLEPTSMKVAIVNLITVSITSQNGLCAAFFDVLKRKTTESTNDLEDSVSNFIIEFLDNIQESPDYLKTPLQEAVLNLLHQLWLSSKAILLQPLTRKSIFWTSFTHPLFVALNLEDKNYSRIIDVLSIELTKICYGKSAVTPEFMALMGSMFQGRYAQFPKTFLTHIKLSIRKDPTDVALLKSLRDFIVLAIVKIPDAFQDNGVRQDIAIYSLRGLLDHIKQPYDSRFIHLWSDIYMYAITKWACTCYLDFDTEMELLGEIFHFFNRYYHNFVVKCRENLLTIACKSIEYMRDTTFKWPELLTPFLNSVHSIMDKEQELFFRSDKSHANHNWTLLIVFTGQLLQMHCAPKYRFWFFTSNFTRHVLRTLGRYINEVDTLPIAKIAMQVLVNYSQTDMYVDFDTHDLELFWSYVRPPPEMLDVGSYDFKTNRLWPYEDFWLTYTGLVQLNINLMERDPNRYFATCITYICMHWDIVGALLCLPSSTVELSALALVQSIVNLVYLLLKRREQWILCAPQEHRALPQLFESLNQCVNSCIQIMLTPKILKFYSLRNLHLMHIEQIPHNILIDIMDHILQILSTAFFCYNRVTPTILELLCYHKVGLPFMVVVECDFSVPRISHDINNKLTYGNLLCLVQILCKILSQVRRTSFPGGFRKGLYGALSSAMTDSPDEDLKFFEAANVPVDELLAFVCPDLIAGYTITDTMKRIAEHEISGLSAPWLAKLDQERTATALDAVATFLASQIYLLVNSYRKSPNYPFYRRDLCSELQLFHEYIKKRYRNILRVSSTCDVVRIHRRLTIPFETIMAAPKPRPEKTGAVSKKTPAKQITASAPEDAGDVPATAARSSSSAPCSSSSSSSSSSGEESGTQSGDEDNAIMDRPDPEVFYAWRRDFKPDNFFTPAQPLDELDPIAGEEYLLLIAHWFKYTCHLND